MAAGVPDDLYLSSTPHEVVLLLNAIAERESRSERAAALRAGFVVAGFFNARRRKKSDRWFKPSDFVRPPARERTAEDVIAQMRAFAKAHNERRRRNNEA